MLHHGGMLHSSAQRTTKWLDDLSSHLYHPHSVHDEVTWRDLSVYHHPLARLGCIRFSARCSTYTSSGSARNFAVQPFLGPVSVHVFCIGHVSVSSTLLFSLEGNLPPNRSIPSDNHNDRNSSRRVDKKTQFMPRNVRALLDWHRTRRRNTPAAQAVYLANVNGLRYEVTRLDILLYLFAIKGLDMLCRTPSSFFVKFKSSLSLESFLFFRGQARRHNFMMTCQTPAYTWKQLHDRVSTTESYTGQSMHVKSLYCKQM